LRGQIEKLQAFDAFDDLVKAASVKVDAELQTDFATETGTMRSWLESQEARGQGFVAFSCRPRCPPSLSLSVPQTVSSSGP